MLRRKASLPSRTLPMAARGPDSSCWLTSRCTSSRVTSMH